MAIFCQKLVMFWSTFTLETFSVSVTQDIWKLFLTKSKGVDREFPWKERKDREGNKQAKHQYTFGWLTKHINELSSFYSRNMWVLRCLYKPVHMAYGYYRWLSPVIYPRMKYKCTSILRFHRKAIPAHPVEASDTATTEGGKSILIIRNLFPVSIDRFCSYTPRLLHGHWDDHHTIAPINV